MGVTFYYIKMKKLGDLLHLAFSSILDGHFHPKLNCSLGDLTRFRFCVASEKVACVEQNQTRPRCENYLRFLCM